MWMSLIGRGAHRHGVDRRPCGNPEKLWADGLSASQIAKQLGGVTRNAVIGKVHRLGLSGRAKSTSSSAKPRRPRTAAPATGAAPKKPTTHIRSRSAQRP